MGSRVAAEAAALADARARIADAQAALTAAGIPEQLPTGGRLSLRGRIEALRDLVPEQLPGVRYRRLVVTWVPAPGHPEDHADVVVDSLIQRHLAALRRDLDRLAAVGDPQARGEAGRG